MRGAASHPMWSALPPEKGGTNIKECRFNFPIECEDQAALKEDGVWKFVPRRNEPLLQRYNSYVTQSWRANTDFGAIVSKDVVLNYIAKYASKA